LPVDQLPALEGGGRGERRGERGKKREGYFEGLWGEFVERKKRGRKKLERSLEEIGREPEGGRGPAMIS